ncbi:MAG: S1 RNA-binding domain-containing protein [Anaerolineaceae bacterium]|nr:S1 RNA-binding domain-containing protein [Anaerolineaceae bacterium]
MSDVEIKRKMKFSGKVLKMSLAGAVIDIGVNQPAVLHISQLPAETKTAATVRVDDILEIGESVDVWVRRIQDEHVEVTMIEPLELEWREIKKGMVVKGKVVRLEKFGAFVEIGAERPGLIHISELAHGYVREPSEVVKEGEEIEAEVIEVHRRKKQIKLSMKALQPEPVKEETVKYTNINLEAKEKPKPKRKTRKPRQQSDVDGKFLENLESSSGTKEESEPTAMEIAFREAMDRAKSRKQESKARKEKSLDEEQDNILTRTLEQKVNS